MVKPSNERRLSSAGSTDVGRQRKHNEDSILVRADLDLFCVADGMGGHNAGDVASKLVITSIANYFEATRDGGSGVEADLGDDYAALSRGAKRLVAAVVKANRDVHTISNTHHQHHGMGSTCVAMHIADGHLHVAHVGDSRCYRLRGGSIEQLTRDHSLVNDALEMKPDLTKEELARLPKNIITRALGMKDLVKVDVKSQPVEPGDVFLLCSDGLTGMVSVEEILATVELTPDVKEACDLLVAQANEHGGTDNISALLVRVPNVTVASEAILEDAPSAAELREMELATTMELKLAPGALPATPDPAPAPRPVPPPRPSEPLRRGPPPPPPVPRPSSPGQRVAPGAQAGPTEPATATQPAAATEPVMATEPATATEPAAATQPAAPPDQAKPPAPREPLGIIATAPSGKAIREQVEREDREREQVRLPPKTRSSRPPAAVVLPPSSRRPHVLEMVDEMAEGAEHDLAESTLDMVLLTDADEAALFAANADKDLDLRGAWSAATGPSVPRCKRCRFELLPGNAFCVECGQRIDEADRTGAE